MVRIFKANKATFHCYSLKRRALLYSPNSQLTIRCELEVDKGTTFGGCVKFCHKWR